MWLRICVLARGYHLYALDAADRPWCPCTWTWWRRRSHDWASQWRCYPFLHFFLREFWVIWACQLEEGSQTLAGAMSTFGDSVRPNSWIHLVRSLCMCDEASSSLKSSQVWHPSFADGFTNHCTNEAFAALSLQSYRHRWINQTMRSLYTPNKQKKIYIYIYI